MIIHRKTTSKSKNYLIKNRLVEVHLLFLGVESIFGVLAGQLFPFKPGGRVMSNQARSAKGFTFISYVIEYCKYMLSVHGYQLCRFVNSAQNNHIMTLRYKSIIISYVLAFNNCNT